MLVVDETGDLKKGIHTVGGAAPVQRHRGSGRDAQVAVYLAYAGTGGQAMIDRELYLPQSWTSNADRLDEAECPRRSSS